MKKINIASAALTLAAVFVAAPAAAQTTWNFGNGGNCDITGSTAALNCIAGTNNTVLAEGYSALYAAGSQYVRGTLTDQGGSGLGFTGQGEGTNPGSPQHGFDNNGAHELLFLNFGTNKVVISSFTTGWSNTDTDVSLLRWVGTAAPNSMPTMNVTTANLLSSGWALVGSADLDRTNTTDSRNFGLNTFTSGLAANAANSSSWWIISSYFGANVTTGTGTGNLDGHNDYFKLLSVQSTCVSNSSGGACNVVPRGSVPEPGSLALAGLALAGVAWVRRRKLAD